MLGKKPKYLLIDNSSAATHSDKNDSKNTATKKGSKFPKTDNQKDEERLKIPSTRKFNQDFLRLMESVRITPRTTGIGAKEQNGDVESYNGHLKSRIKQCLLIRGSCDFKSVEEVQEFIQEAVDKSNNLHKEKIKEEIKKMSNVNVKHLRDYSELRVRVRKNSTISVKGHLYSVSSRFIGFRVKVKLYEDRLEVYYKNKLKQKSRRLHQTGKHNIKYQHLVRGLVKKPGAFIRMNHQYYMFPNLIFRKAYDSLLTELSERRASLEYLRILNFCLDYGESEVEEALQLLMEENELPDFTKVESLISPWKHEYPEQEIYKPELSIYDGLLSDTHTKEMLEVR
ncbi:MAG: Mu transposase domain-containing protein [Myxococcota bacterium]